MDNAFASTIFGTTSPYNSVSLLDFSNSGQALIHGDVSVPGHPLRGGLVDRYDVVQTGGMTGTLVRNVVDTSTGSDNYILHLNPGMSSNGSSVAYVANYDAMMGGGPGGPGMLTTGNADGVFVSIPTDPVNGGANMFNTTISSMGPPFIRSVDINNFGMFAFVHGSSATGLETLRMFNGTALSTIATEGTPAPGGGMFSSFAFYGVAINDSGQVAFGAQLDLGSGVYVGGLFMFDPATGVIDSVAMPGDINPDGTIAGVGWDPTGGLNDAGSLAAHIRYTSGFEAIYRIDPLGGSAASPLPGVLSPGGPFVIGVAGGPILSVAEAEVRCAMPRVVCATGELNHSAVGTGPPTFIDPDIAVGYEYSLSEGMPNFFSVLIPETLPMGDDEFNLHFNGMTFTLLAGERFFFNDHLVEDEGIETFIIDGIEVEEMLDPENTLAFVTGITLVDFVPQGGGDIFMTPIVVSDLQPGDANDDGRVDAADLNILALNWQMMVTGGPSDGDFNDDGVVNAGDLNELALNWQFGVDQPSLVSMEDSFATALAMSVPEPSSLTALLGIGSMTLFCRRLA